MAVAVSNQSVPFEDVDLLAGDVALREGARARGCGMGTRARARGRSRRRLCRGATAFPARRAQRAAADHPRPLRPPRRPGRARPELALAARRRGVPPNPCPAVGRSAPGRARRPRGAGVRLDARQRGRHVPDLDDLQRRARAAGRPGARRRVGAAPDRRRAVRDGDDREAGRLGRARQHDPGRAGRRRLVRAHRPQVVLLLSALRHLPRAGPGARRPVLLRARARARDGVPAPQGQARHALAAVVGGRVPARLRHGCWARRAAAWRRSSRWSRTRGWTA